MLKMRISTLSMILAMGAAGICCMGGGGGVLRRQQLRFRHQLRRQELLDVGKFGGIKIAKEISADGAAAPGLAEAAR